MNLIFLTQVLFIILSITLLVSAIMFFWTAPSYLQRISKTLENHNDIPNEKIENMCKWLIESRSKRDE